MEQKLAEAMVEGTTLPGKLSAAQSEDLPTIEELDSDGEEEGEGPWTRIEEGSMDMASSSGSSATDKQVEWEGQSGEGDVFRAEWERPVVCLGQSGRGDVFRAEWERWCVKGRVGEVVCSGPSGGGGNVSRAERERQCGEG